MKKNQVVKAVVCSLALWDISGAAQADSLRIKWIGNGHFYQLIDTPLRTWFDAQTSCQQKGAHLTTITTLAENSFINAQQTTVWNTPRNWNYFWIGATDQQTEGTIKWVTGEPWGYNNLAPVFINVPDYDYAYYRLGSGDWPASSSNDTLPYLCEWSANNFIGVTYVPDLNNNRISETAALYVDFVTGKHTVKIKDPQTQGMLSTLTFLTNLEPPQGVVSLADINGNRVPEIAVLYKELNQPTVGIKDAKNNGALLKSIRFLGTAFEPKAISVAPDSNANGASEIIVLGINKTSGAAKSETRDSKTGALLKSTVF